MGGSAKAPKKSDEQERMERRALEIQEEQLALAKKPLDLPKIEPPKPAPPPAPPARESDEAAWAAEEARRKALRRTNAGRGTLFAGETGGYRGNSNLGGRRALLG